MNKEQNTIQSTIGFEVKDEWVSVGEPMDIMARYDAFLEVRAMIGRHRNEANQNTQRAAEKLMERAEQSPGRWVSSQGVKVRKK